MSRWRDDPDLAAGDLLARVAGKIFLTDNFARRFLAIDGPPLDPVLARAGVLHEQDQVVWWSRWSMDMAPPDGPFDTAFLRLPKSRDAFIAAAHLAFGRLGSDGALVVYGGNDEGIRAATGQLAGFDTRFETVAALGHGRVLRARRPVDPAHVKARAADWRHVGLIDLGAGKRPWISYAGCFAGGGLDEGTKLLLSVLPAIVRPGMAALDFACGTGVIARAVLDVTAGVAVDLVEIDVWARAAAAENVPEARQAYRDLTAVPHLARYDLVVSNPPFHEGFREDRSVMDALIARAPDLLRPGGRLVMVTQARFGIGRDLEALGGPVAMLAEDARFRVWSAVVR